LLLQEAAAEKVEAAEQGDIDVLFPGKLLEQTVLLSQP
jgi:hypothetical protein